MRMVRNLLYIWSSNWKDFDLKKLLNLAGSTVKYGLPQRSLNHSMLHLLSETYSLMTLQNLSNEINCTYLYVIIVGSTGSNFSMGSPMFPP